MGLNHDHNSRSTQASPHHSTCPSTQIIIPQFSSIAHQFRHDHLRDDLWFPLIYMHTQEAASTACIHFLNQQIRQYKYLQKVDLSYNCLPTLHDLSGLKHLTEIRAVNNQLTNILDMK